MDIFGKVITILQYYRKIIDKDPFIQLNLNPLKYDIPNQNCSKYAEFIATYGKEYTNRLMSTFLSLPQVYVDILKQAEKSGLIEEIKKNRGLKLSDAKLEISQNIIAKVISDQKEQDKFRAAYYFKIAYDFYKHQNYIEAKKALEEALKYDPNSPYIIYNLFLVSYLTSDFERVQEMIKNLAILGFKEIDFFSK
ncbi:MAG: tetratricopeptide repeat protein [Candidatus Calescibacterium sp.]|nr:tetratricopeptide repeat protein [Candidatus Calescibacterium sp.]MCX7972395.1 tetratricopeptide repeat protein [bacterium]MDW8195714.1 tetratricopeptide repeat protein [Candidatus Calescibacterium sp.]